MINCIDKNKKVNIKFKTRRKSPLTTVNRQKPQNLIANRQNRQKLTASRQSYTPIETLWNC